MRKGQRASSSSESEGSQRPRSKDSKDQSSPRGCSSDEDSSSDSDSLSDSDSSSDSDSLSDSDSSSDSDVEVKHAMKRSQRFSSSFSFGEVDQPGNKDRDEQSLKNSNGVPIAEVVQAECVGQEKQDTSHDASQPPRSGLFRPQELWLAVTRCLSLRWPPCLSINRQSNTKLAYHAAPDQSEDIQSSIGSESANGCSSSTSTFANRDVISVKKEEEEVKNKAVNSFPARCRGVSRSTPRLPRASQATHSLLASMILEKETFLRIELVDSGDEKEDLRYRADWKLSERTQELAEGVWLSQSQKLMD